MKETMQNNLLLAMMPDSETVLKSTEAWMNAVPKNTMAMQSMAMVATTSAIGLGIYSQMAGAMLGAMQGAAENIASTEFAAPAQRSAEEQPVKSTVVRNAKPKASAKPSAKKPKKVVSKTETKADPADPSAFVRPPQIDKPKKPHDLKVIAGVGPKLETVLNDLGIWTYEQIAAWKPMEVAWIDDLLQFGGRIERDGWLEQAAKLAKNAG